VPEKDESVYAKSSTHGVPLRLYRGC